MGNDEEKEEEEDTDYSGIYQRMKPEDRQLLRHMRDDSIWHFTVHDFYMLVDLRLLAICMMTPLFIYEYYVNHCQWTPVAQRWFSKDMYLPKDTRFSVLNAF